MWPSGTVVWVAWGRRTVAAGRLLKLSQSLTCGVAANSGQVVSELGGIVGPPSWRPRIGCRCWKKPHTYSKSQAVSGVPMFLS